MIKNVGFLVCVLIMILDVVAGILGLEAEIAQNKVKHYRKWIFKCREPSYKTFQLGLAAAVLLAFSHAIGNLFGRCTWMWSKEDFNKATADKQLAVASLICSWVILAVGFSMLIIGTLANSKSGRYCGISHHRVLAVGGILCFIHGLFLVAYYVSASAAAKEEKFGPYHHGHDQSHGAPDPA